MDWQNTQNAVRSLGDIDLLVNNAAIIERSPFIDVTADSFDRRIAALFTHSFALEQLCRGYV